MHIYLGLFLVALATLAFEITLSRLLSVVAWYHLGFFAISVAMLGITACSISVFLGDRAFSGLRLILSVRRAGFAFRFARRRRCVPRAADVVGLVEAGALEYESRTSTDHAFDQLYLTTSETYEQKRQLPMLLTRTSLMKSSSLKHGLTICKER